MLQFQPLEGPLLPSSPLLWRLFKWQLLSQWGSESTLRSSGVDKIFDVLKLWAATFISVLKGTQREGQVLANHKLA